MAVTPNYSWPVPDDTDLVKDGAEAIRDLGNAIDTTVDGLPSGGLVHIETQDLATKSAQSFDNVFTSDFRHYKIIFECVHSTSATTQLRLRVAGADNSTANYVNVGAIGLASSTANFRVTSQTLFGISGLTGTSQAEITLFKPNLATPTTGIHLDMDGDSAIRMVGSNFTLSTAFDGFTFLISTGTFTSGQISVYGLKD